MTPILLVVLFWSASAPTDVRTTYTSLMQIFVGEATGRGEQGNLASLPGDHESPPLFGFADEPAEMSA